MAQERTPNLRKEEVCIKGRRGDAKKVGVKGKEEEAPREARLLGLDVGEPGGGI